MSDFSQPWNDEDGVKGLWPGGKKPRNEEVYKRICERRTEHVRLCREWKAAAEADGWTFEPTYASEPVEQAFRGYHEGFTIQGIARPQRDTRCPSASIHIWGPDGLYVKPPLLYDMAEIRANAHTCQYCQAINVETTRVGFAGRCCLKCEPTVRPQIETPGWNS